MRIFFWQFFVCFCAFWSNLWSSFYTCTLPGSSGIRILRMRRSVCFVKVLYRRINHTGKGPALMSVRDQEPGRMPVFLFSFFPQMTPAWKKPERVFLPGSPYPVCLLFSEVPEGISLPICHLPLSFHLPLSRNPHTICLFSRWHRGHTLRVFS